MCFLCDKDIALINKHRRPANRLGFAVLKPQSDLWHEYATREQTRFIPEIDDAVEGLAYGNEPLYY